MTRLKSMGVMSAAKISGIIYFALSLLFVPFLLLGGIATLLVPKSEGTLPGVMLIAFAVVAPFFYGAMGFATGALMAWAYNVAAERLGGIEMQFEGPPQPVAMGSIAQP